MPVFSDIPPTAGFSLGFGDVFRALFSRNRKSLDDEFREFLGVPYAKVCCSGTSSLYVILEALKKLTDKRTVIIPAYICPLVPFAVHRAGFKVELCDIRKDNFCYDEKMLTKICAYRKDIAAVVVDHLAGIPVEISNVEKLAKKGRFFVIEDCAQSLGAEYNGKKIGTRGDFSFFSMAAGKGLTTYEGGVMATRHAEYAGLLEETYNRVVKREPVSEIARTIELLGYCIFYTKRLFWFVFTLQQLYWTRKGDDVKAFREDFSSDFPLHHISSFRKRIGQLQFSRLKDEIIRQRKKFGLYSDLISSGHIIGESKKDKASCPFLSYVCSSVKVRNELLKTFENKGMGVSVIYARALTQYDYLSGIVSGTACPNAEMTASRTISLSTNSLMDDNTIRKVCGIISRLEHRKK